MWGEQFPSLILGGAQQISQPSGVLLTDIPRRAERTGDTRDDVAKDTSDGVVDMLRTMMSACAEGGTEEIGASAAEWVGARE